jgi:hypothetical protein
MLSRFSILFFGVSVILFSCKKNTPVVELPAGPTDLVASLASARQVDLRWTDRSTNETSYKIQRKTGTASFADIATVGQDVTSFSDVGLALATTYTYRVYAVNSRGASLMYSNEVTITTGGLPVLTTNQLADITNSTARSGGNITDNSGSSITARGVVWSTSPMPTILLSTKTIDGSGTGSFSSVLNNLSINTTYYVRAYATNAAGTSYGNEVTFKTLSVDITTGLVAFYPFNGNANDESGNGANGTVNGAVLASDRFGNANKAYSFNGNAFISSTPTALPVNNSARSFTAFIFYQQPQTYNDWSCILSYGGGNVGNINDIFIGLSKADQVYFNAGEFGNTSTPSNSYSSTWTHIAVTYDGINLNNVKIYINGIEQSANFFNNRNLTTLTTQNSLFLIGRSNPFYSSKLFYFNGRLDDIRVYNRALKKEEIEHLAKN